MVRVASRSSDPDRRTVHLIATVEDPEAIGAILAAASREEAGGRRLRNYVKWWAVKDSNLIERRGPAHR
jgi:hypothetical protein